MKADVVAEEDGTAVLAFVRAAWAGWQRQVHGRTVMFEILISRGADACAARRAERRQMSGPMPLARLRADHRTGASKLHFRPAAVHATCAPEPRPFRLSVQGQDPRCRSGQDLPAKHARPTGLWLRREGLALQAHGCWAPAPRCCLPQSSAPPWALTRWAGLFVETSEQAGIEAFIAGLAAHRHFARETDAPWV